MSEIRQLTPAEMDRKLYELGQFFGAIKSHPPMRRTANWEQGSMAVRIARDLRSRLAAAEAENVRLREKAAEGCRHCSFTEMCDRGDPWVNCLWRPEREAALSQQNVSQGPQP